MIISSSFVKKKYKHYIYDFTTSMRVPSVQTSRESQFCVLSSCKTAIIFDFSKGCFVIINLDDYKPTGELKIPSSSKLLSEDSVWHGIRCIENTLPPIILAVVLEGTTQEYFSILFKLNHEEDVAVPIEKKRIGVKAIHSDSISYIISDENDICYFVEYWCSSIEQQTKFHIVKLEVKQSVVNPKILADRIIHYFCYGPFIMNNCITFILHDENFSEAISLNLSNLEERIKYSILAPHSHKEVEKKEAYPRNHTFSVPYLHKNIIYYYFVKSRVGELWGLDFHFKKWRKYFELTTHAIGEDAIIFVTEHGRLFLHGDCADEDCTEKAHLYHFGVSLLNEIIYPTINQLGALLSSTKVQIFYGSNAFDKTRIMKLKAFKALISNRENVKIVVSSSELLKEFKQFMFSTFGPKYGSNNIISCTKKDMELNSELFEGSDIFFFGFLNLSFEQKQFLLKRDGKTFITLNDECSISSGFDQPQSDEFSWHPFDSRTENNWCRENCAIPQRESGFQTFIKQSMNAMDQFYGVWWDCANKETIFIPACLDVAKNSIHFSVDAKAVEFDQQNIENQKSRFKGQNAESSFAHLFPKLKIGGVYISGINSREFFISLKRCKLSKKDIQEFEIDAIFMHPLCGIIVFEIKATEKLENVEKVIKKANMQIENMKQKLLKMFQKICDANLLCPIHFALCFPNVDVPVQFQNQTYFLLDKAFLFDDLKLKEFMQSKIIDDPIAGPESDALKILAATLAGYRSLDYLSGGYNALAVHKIIDSQNFQRKKIKSGHDGIFLTNDQLAILNCSEQHQIISGPPGTGKTLMLLRMALDAASKDKKGQVRIITGRPELILRFQKFFEARQESIKRFPLIHYEYLSQNDYDDNDDIFADEFYLNSKLFNERFVFNGRFVIVLTGLFNPLEIEKVYEWIIAKKLDTYRCFEMKTVIRSSKHIFNEWEPQYQQNNISMRLGHEVFGPSVRREKFENSDELLRNLLKFIQDLFGLNGLKDTSNSNELSFENLCIITESEHMCTLIKSYLSSYKTIACGSIEDQIVHPNIVAVSTYQKTVSQEWPIVIVVSMFSTVFPRNFFLIAATRCIAKLIIIERDYEKIKEKLDEKIKSLISTGSTLDYEIFCDEVKKVEQDGLLDDSLADFEAVFQIIGRNFLPTVLTEKSKYFQDCHSLSDCWQRIADVPAICRVFLEQATNIRNGFSKGFFLLSGQPSKLFRLITSKHLSESEQDSNWQIFQRLVRTLTDIVENEKGGHELNAMEAEEKKQVVEDTEKYQFEWKIVQSSISYLLM